MKVLEITGCSRPGMWYANKIGQRVPYCGYWVEGFSSREPAGYTNLVLFEDAQVLEIGEDGQALFAPVPGVSFRPPAMRRDVPSGPAADVTLWLPEAELLRLAEFGGYVRALPKAAPGFVPVRVVGHG